MPAFPEEHLPALALLALVVAHGADADLDPREVDVLAERLRRLDPALSGDQLAGLVRDAAEAYLDARVQGIERLVERLGAELSAEDRARAYRALAAVAEADGTVHPMEHTLLRHLAEAWGVTP